jgi:hydroxyacylglutathione hydrolase
MRIDGQLHLVMSGGGGFDLTDAFDCNVFMVDSGDGWLMFDAGAGRDDARVEAVLAADGIAPRDIRHLFITHGHADHSGGAAHVRAISGCTVHAAALTADWMSSGNEDAISLGKAKRAGVYPLDYVYRPCPVDSIVTPGVAVRVGDVTVEPVATPGHSRDHTSYLVTTPSRRLLIAGDALFHGGKVAIQDIEDCNIAATCRTVRTLAALEFDALLSGHLAFSLRDGHRHAVTALGYVEALHVPPSII